MSQDALIPQPTTTRTAGRLRVEHPGRAIADRTIHVHADRCKTCKAPILRGLHDLQAAFEIRADPQPLTAIGEALAQLAGRRTITLQLVGGQLRFTGHRRAAQILARPAGTGHRDIHPIHECGTVPLPTAPTAFPPPSAVNPDAPPPF